jgi:hypothetical protein
MNAVAKGSKTNGTKAPCFLYTEFDPDDVGVSATGGVAGGKAATGTDGIGGLAVTVGAKIGASVGGSAGFSAPTGFAVGEFVGLPVGVGFVAPGDEAGLPMMEVSQHPRKSPSTVGQHIPNKPVQLRCTEHDAGSNTVGEAVNSVGTVQSTSSNEYSIPLWSQVNVRPWKCSFKVKFAYRNPQLASIVLFGLNVERGGQV